MLSPIRTVRRFNGDERGSLAVATAVGMIGLITLSYALLNLGMLAKKQSMLQAAVDGAAVAIAKNFQIIGSDASERPVSDLAYAYMKIHMQKSGAAFTVKADADKEKGEVTVKASLKVEGLLQSDFLSAPNTLTATASARVIGKVPVCVIGLDEAASSTVRLNKESQMTGNGCAIYSNSTAPNGLKSKDSAVIKAELICSAGGKDGPTENFTPQPLLDCPVYDDPLKGRPGPDIGECMDTSDYMSDAGFVEIAKVKNNKKSASLTLDSGYHSLKPGTYCGGITISGDAEVAFAPGIYVLKDGPLSIEDEARIKGEYTSFYFTGSGAVFSFADNTEISLSAAASGVMAGLLFQEDTDNPEGQTHEIFSNNARMLVGTIYLPQGKVHIGGASRVGQDAAYTAIIARQLELDAGPHVVLNTDYAATDVPIPDGVYGKGAHVLLTK